MHNTVQNLISIEDEIRLSLKEKKINKLPKVIAVSKTFEIDKIFPLISHGHINFGEFKVHEAMYKWEKIKMKIPKLNYI